MMGLWCFLQNIVWKRLNVQEGGKTRLSITEEERVICFSPIMLLKNTVLLLVHMNFAERAKIRSTTANPAKTTTDDAYMDKHCAQNVMWSALTLVSLLLFFLSCESQSQTLMNADGPSPSDLTHFSGSHHLQMANYQGNNAADWSSSSCLLLIVNHQPVSKWNYFHVTI